MNVRDPLVIRIVALMAALASPAPLSAQQPAGAVKIGDTPPAFLLNDLTGRTVRVPEDIRGKVAVIHFWGSWCTFCVNEMKALDALTRAYRARGLAAFSINAGEPKEAVERYVRNAGISYPILLDPDKSVSIRYGVVSIPMTFIVDRRGVIKHKVFGEMNGTVLRKLIVPLLKN